MIFRCKKIEAELVHMNAYLALIAEVLQQQPEAPEPEKFPQPLIDASELLARWLWLQLPEESKKDLMP